MKKKNPSKYSTYKFLITTPFDQEALDYTLLFSLILNNSDILTSEIINTWLTEQGFIHPLKGRSGSGLINSSRFDESTLKTFSEKGWRGLHTYHFSYYPSQSSKLKQSGFGYMDEIEKPFSSLKQALEEIGNYWFELDNSYLTSFQLENKIWAVHPNFSKEDILYILLIS